jgi:hypothetical protein
MPAQKTHLIATSSGREDGVGDWAQEVSQVVRLVLAKALENEVEARGDAKAVAVEAATSENGDLEPVRQFGSQRAHDAPVVEPRTEANYVDDRLLAQDGKAGC